MEFQILLRVEYSVTHFLSCLIIHKNNCTYDSSSKVHLFARFNVWVLFCFCFYKGKEKGSDFSNKAGFLQTCSFILFFLLKLLAACSLVVTTVSWDG